MDSIETRVRAGIAFLDAYGPRNWRAKITAAIKAGRFDLGNPSHCALGEVYGHFTKGAHKLGIYDETSDYGFDSSYAPNITYDDLTREWTRQYRLGAAGALKAQRAVARAAKKASA